MVLTPDYAGPTTGRPPSISLYKVAMLFAAAPSVIGLSILGLYVLTEWQVWMTCGFWALPLGLLSVLTAAVLAAVHDRQGRRCGDPETRSLTRARLWRVAGLILFDFAAAAFCVIAGGYRAAEVMTAYRITVTNSGTVPVTSLVITAGNRDTELGPIAPGATVKRKISPPSGALTYRVTVGGRELTGTLDEYFAEGMGVRRTMTIDGSKVVVSP